MANKTTLTFPMKFNWRKIFVYNILVLGFVTGVIWGSNTIITRKTQSLTFSSTQEIPANKVGLVLGTSRYLTNGWENLYFTYRINATAELFNTGKIKYVLVSGDNGNKKYDEPTDFKNALIDKGIPANKIVLDYAGFRTLDSVVRAKEVFGQKKYTIISQKFHNERAIYLAAAKGMDVVGFNAKDVSNRYGLRVQLREYLARVKVFVDLLFNVQPKFLGKKISIG